MSAKCSDSSGGNRGADGSGSVTVATLRLCASASGGTTNTQPAAPRIEAASEIRNVVLAMRDIAAEDTDLSALGNSVRRGTPSLEMPPQCRLRRRRAQRESTLSMPPSTRSDRLRRRLYVTL